MGEYSTVDWIRLLVPAVLLLVFIPVSLFSLPVSSFFTNGLLFSGLFILGAVEFFGGCKTRALFYFVALAMNVFV